MLLFFENLKYNVDSKFSSLVEYGTMWIVRRYQRLRGEFIHCLQDSTCTLLKMGTATSFEILVSIYQSTRRHIPEHWYLICFLCTKVISSDVAVLFEFYVDFFSINRVIQEERSVFWKMILSVILRKTVCITCV